MGPSKSSNLDKMTLGQKHEVVVLLLKSRCSKCLLLICERHEGREAKRYWYLYWFWYFCQGSRILSMVTGIWNGWYKVVMKPIIFLEDIHWVGQKVRIFHIILWKKTQANSLANPILPKRTKSLWLRFQVMLGLRNISY